MNKILVEIKAKNLNTGAESIIPKVGDLPINDNNIIPLELEGETDEELILKLMIHVLAVYSKAMNKDNDYAKDFFIKWKVYEKLRIK